MRILLPLQSDFLRSTFPRTRYTLEGRWHKVRLVHTEVELFSSEQRLVADVQTPVAPQVPEILQFPQPHDQPSATRVSLPSAFRFIVQTALSIFIVCSFLFALVLFVPDLYYQVFPVTAETIVLSESQRALTNQQVVSPQEAPAYLPPKDETLPEGSWLVIPRIGVRTQLQRTETAQEALETGVWQVPDFGEPGDTQKPVILAAHRFGWKWWWQSEYWKYHSFYLLPDTEPGDRIEILYDQRKWVYEIYAGTEGTEIEDYSADVILYTCKFLNSDVRHIRYARLINPEESTQDLTSGGL